jgi:hypothetical protein
MPFIISIECDAAKSCGIMVGNTAMYFYFLRNRIAYTSFPDSISYIFNRGNSLFLNGNLYAQASVAPTTEKPLCISIFSVAY